MAKCFSSIEKQDMMQALNRSKRILWMSGGPKERLNIPCELHVCICPALLPSDLSFPQEASFGEKDAAQEERMRTRDAFLRLRPEGQLAPSQCLARPSNV